MAMNAKEWLENNAPDFVLEYVDEPSLVDGESQWRSKNDCLFYMNTFQTCYHWRDTLIKRPKNDNIN